MNGDHALTSSEPDRREAGDEWATHITEVLDSSISLAGHLTGALVESAWKHIDSTKKATLFIAVIATGAFGLGGASAVLGSAILDAPAEIEEVRENLAATQAHVRQVDRDVERLVSRMDLLICELQEERSGEIPESCPQRGIIFR
jgi:hypothetical protein